MPSAWVVPPFTSVWSAGSVAFADVRPPLFIIDLSLRLSLDDTETLYRAPPYYVLYKKIKIHVDSL